MVATARTPADISAMVGHIPPEGAIEAHVARARALCNLNKIQVSRADREKPCKHGKETLEELAKQYDPDNRRWTARSVWSS